MSSAVDEDTARAIHSGRETLGALLSGAQAHLQKVFIFFLLGFVGSFYALRIVIWDFLEATAKAEMNQLVADQTDLITRTPFEVILLQAKIGMIMGIIVAIPPLVYFSRDALRRRGYTSVVPISRRSLVGFGVTSFGLFWIGIAYAYVVFFPYAFDFLSTNAVQTGVKPSFGITEFTEFIALLTLSFGLAAQLPLFMGVLSYTEIVPYETFRDKWRHAVVAITVFGALFSPPDPFTLIMWTLPLVTLYVFSLGLSKLITNIRRKGAVESVGTGSSHLKYRISQFFGVIAAVFVAATSFVAFEGFRWLESAVYPSLPESLRPGGETALEALSAEYGVLGDLAGGLLVAIGVGLVVLFVYTVRVLQNPVYPREDLLRAADPEDIDLEVLEAGAIEKVPPAVFLEMEEEEALDHARRAMVDENREKAQAILDRFDGLQEQADADGDVVDNAGASGAAATEAGDDEGESLFKSTAAGMLDPFTEDETTEDDIGGYAYDIAFILNSLTSKAFRIVAVFMTVLAGSFFWLYSGGLRNVLETFLARVPEDVLHEVAVRNDVDPAGMGLSDLIDQMNIVIALHPVEVLIFNVQVSTLAAIVAVLPMVLYYSWPAAKKRGLVYGDRRVFVVWGGSLLVGFAVGTYLGFFWIAPTVISYLVADAINNGMVVSFRIKSFFWLVIFTTVGIGFLFNMIVTMALFHVGNIVSYRTMLRGWRLMVFTVFTVAAFVSPKGVLTMLALATPVALTYVLGLVVLYVLTGGGRFFGGGGGGSDGQPRASEPEGGLTVD